MIALWNNRPLRAAYARLAASRADLRGVVSFPELFLGGEARFPTGGGRVALDLDLVQDLFALVTRSARTDVALAHLEHDVLEVGALVLDLALEVRSTYYELVAVQQSIAVHREIAAAAAAARALAESMFEAGNLSHLHLAHEQAMDEEARLELARVQLELVPLRERMNVLLGLWGERVDWTAPERLPDVPAADPAREGLERLAVERRLELAAGLQHLAMISKELGIERDWRGIVSLEAGIAAEREHDGEWGIGPAFGIGLPLSGMTRARVERLEAELLEAREELAGLAVEIRADVRASHAKLVQSRQLAERYREVIVPLREKIVRLAQEEYNYMLIGAFELLEDRREQSHAYHEYIETVRDYWIAHSELRHAVGGAIFETDTEGSETNTEGQ